MDAREKLQEYGYEDVKILVNETYDDALIGVSEDNRAVYDFGLMIEWLMNKYGWTMEESVEWIEYNTIRALPYFGDDAPIIVYPLS